MRGGAIRGRQGVSNASRESSSALAFDAFLGRVPVAMLVFDPLGRLVYANPAVRRITQLANLDELSADRILGGRIERALRGRGAEVSEIVVGEGDDQVVLGGWVAPVSGPDGKLHVVASLVDSTWRQRLEQEQGALHAEIAQRDASLEAIRAVLSTILAGGEREDALRLIAKRVRRLTRADFSALALPSGKQGQLVVTAAEGRAAESLVGLAIPEEGSLVGDALHRWRTVISTSLERDQRAPRVLLKLGGGPALFVPLVARRRASGVLCLGRNVDGRPFDRDETRVAETFAENASVALELDLAQRQLARLAVLEDRERIARDLHDGLVQSLFGVGMALSAAVAVADGGLAGRLEQTVEELDRLVVEVRNYIASLRSGEVTPPHMGQALRDLILQLSARTGLATVVDVDEALAVDLSPHAGHLVAIAREACSNVARHADATTCRLRLWKAPAHAVLEIDDDGSGFVLEQARGRGLGLFNLETRADEIGGRFEIRTSPGKGTNIRVLVPLPAPQP